MLEARPDGCQEAALGMGNAYIPCNQPAVSMVGWPLRREGPYRMCAMCADHNTRNRGATLIGPYIDVTSPLWVWAA